MHGQGLRAILILQREVSCQKYYLLPLLIKLHYILDKYSRGYTELVVNLCNGVSQT